MANICDNCNDSELLRKSKCLTPKCPASLKEIEKKMQENAERITALHEKYCLPCNQKKRCAECNVHFQICALRRANLEWQDCLPK